MKLVLAILLTVGAFAQSFPSSNTPLLASDDSGATVNPVRTLYFPSGTLSCSGATCTFTGGGSSSLVAPYQLVFSSSQSETVTAATHEQGSNPLDGGCYTSDGKVEQYDTWTRNGSGDVTVTFATPFTGRCAIFNGSGGGSVGGDFTLPTASETILGGIKVGSGLSITSGILSATSSSYTAGTGVDITSGVISVLSTIVPTYLTNSASLTFSTFGLTGNCEEQNITLPGASIGDAVGLGPPQMMPAGVIQGGTRVSSANTVTITLCRLAGTGTITAQTFRVWINKLL